MVSGYLIAEEGPLAGLIIAFEEEKEDNTWSLGRDPEASDVTLEDPMVSRQHILVLSTPEGFILENLSTVNPATQNGMMIAEPVLLKEGDIIQVGSTFFRFTEKKPEAPPPEEEKGMEEAPPLTERAAPGMPSDLHFGPSPDTRWLLKVISGPNAGAEFAMSKGATYLIGKDPNICDVVFQDLSVSRQHARITLDEEENVFVEDLDSRNGVIVNGELIDQKQLLASQDLVALGTTTFLVVDRLEARETIISPPSAIPSAYGAPSPERKEDLVAKRERKDWKELIIPKRYLAIAGVFAAAIFTSLFAMLSLFKSEPIMIVQVDENEKIKEAIEGFPGVKFSFNRPSGKLFLIGNVMTTVEQQELMYVLHDIPFITEIDDNVIVDELVWQSTNALLSTNPDWVGVSLYGPAPGVYVLRGYVETNEQSEALADYMNLNFDYLNRLENHVVVEKNLEIEIDSLLVKKGFSGVTYELTNGEIVLAGRVDRNKAMQFATLIRDFQMLPGIRQVKNFVITTSEDTSRINVSDDYKVTGYSKGDDHDFFVVINGKILSQGDLLDGMLITKIKNKVVLLEKAGMRYVIDYNIQ